jgi:hypothetical protein
MSQPLFNGGMTIEELEADVLRLQEAIGRTDILNADAIRELSKQLEIAKLAYQRGLAFEQTTEETS